MLSVWVLSTQQHSTPCRLHLPTELAKQRVLLLSRQALIQNHWHVVPAQVIAETLFKWNGIDKGLWIQRLLADLYYNISYINLAFFQYIHCSIKLPLRIINTSVFLLLLLLLGFLVFFAKIFMWVIWGHIAVEGLPALNVLCCCWLWSFWPVFSCCVAWT